MINRREFLNQASMLAGGAGLLNVLPPSIARAIAIDPEKGSTYLDAEHIVYLMQENRSFDHTYGTLQGVRGYNDPRAITLPDKKPVWFQSNEKGETFAPFRLDIKNTNATWMESLPHGWTDQVDARNNGKYDKWLSSKPSHIEAYKEMPLTLGFYTREDIPFYYSLADAFTVCDHNFCSSLTGTTANRLYYWTGTVRERPDENVLARVWNDDTDENSSASWTTFPERLEENGISWKIYQNEISATGLLKDEHAAWLGNFGDNPIEYFRQFNVRSSPSTLGAKERMLHEKAFNTNKKDPHYHDLETLRYKEGGTEREIKVPKGDILHQFREDVNNGSLPVVSWIVAPQQFSDHPSSAWYGAWYISEVMDILTKNPEIWKKTIFVLTYDENDGYFDHVPPFVAPHPRKKGTGKVSPGIDTSVEYVSSPSQQSSEPGDVRESSIGLGYRVPMVIASPWSRGGWVNSQVFDHTSSLMFLEKFLSKKLKKKIEEPNISKWRRVVCGDLTSAFRPYNGEKLKKPLVLDRNEFLETIHKAQFRNPPSDFKKLTPAEADAVANGNAAPLLPIQEKGTRNANRLPYELYADGNLSADRKIFTISLKASDKLFGEASAGGAFNIYAPGKFKGENAQSWSYAVRPGDTVEDSWPISDFENGDYHLLVYGPNGFYREFRGTPENPQIETLVTYSTPERKDPEITVLLKNNSQQTLNLRIIDNSYNRPAQSIRLNPASGNPVKIALPITGSHGWYDYSIDVEGHKNLGMRYAGRIENGKDGRTDPLMGGEMVRMRT